MNKTGLLPPKCSESPEEKGEDGKKNKLLLYCWAIAVIAEEAGREESRAEGLTLPEAGARGEASQSGGWPGAL